MVRIRNKPVIAATAATLVLGLSGVALAAQGGAHASHSPARTASSAKTVGSARTASSASSASMGTSARPDRLSASATALTRAITYLGYHVTVPASWPVYRLTPDSTRCVLFNQHAVYLGKPGSNQLCPVNAVGKTEALLVQPLGSHSTLPPHTSVQHGNTAELPSGRDAAQDTVNQIWRIALPKAGVQVTASYGHDPSLIRSILDSAHLTAGPDASHQAARIAAGPDRPGHAARPSRSNHSGSKHSGSKHSGSRHKTSRHYRSGRDHAGRDRDDHTRHGGAKKPPAMPMDATAAPTRIGRVIGSGLGFDTCTVPSTGTMKHWLASPFRMVGTYLGGDNWACNYGNFNRSWVTQVATMGWRFIPLWVGPQAPCTSIYGAVRINTANSEAEGRSQAASAVSTAKGFGFGKGSPIYFDMEGYDNLDRSCSHAVLNFLNGWTKALHSAGYTSGVYSSASSGMTDLAGQYHTSGYSEPNDMWFADWDADAVITNSGLSSHDWPGYRRVHQFDGPNVERFGGVSVNIDDDYAAADTAGLISPPGAYAVGQPDALHVARGSTGRTELEITAPKSSSRQTVQWQVQEGHGVTISPDRGSARPEPGQTVTIHLKIKASKSAHTDRNNFRIAASSGGQALSGGTILVSVGSDHQSTPKPLVLYAADHRDILVAEQVAQHMALPAGSVTSSFKTAWRDVAAGKSIVLAVGEDAVTALYRNPCGWSNPRHYRAGSTPFVYLGGPLNHRPGKIYFETSSGVTLWNSTQLAYALTKYALTGTLPDPHAIPASPRMPRSGCYGVPRHA